MRKLAIQICVILIVIWVTLVVIPYIVIKEFFTKLFTK